MNWTPVQLLGILALAAAIEVWAGGSAQWLLLGGLAFALAAVAGSAWALNLDKGTPVTGAPLTPKPLDEPAVESRARLLAYVVTLLVAAISLSVAVVAPVTAFVFLILNAVWTVVWWPRALRTYSLSNTIEIKCDPAKLFDFVSDQRNVPRYYYMFEQSVEKVGDAPIGAGTQFRSRVTYHSGQVPGLKEDRSFAGVEEIVDFEPNRRLTVRLSTGLYPNLGTYTIEPVPGGTRMSYRFVRELSFASCVLGTRLWSGNADRFAKSTREAAWARAQQILESTTA